MEFHSGKKGLEAELGDPQKEGIDLEKPPGFSEELSGPSTDPFLFYKGLGDRNTRA